MRPESRSSDLQCVLCEITDETEITGPLSCKEGIAAHQNCLLYASGIYCKNSPTFDDLFGFDVDDVKDEYKRGRKLTCAYCKRKGATAGCEVKSCKRSYHYPCAQKARALPEEDQSNGTFTLYCEKHNPHASSGDSEKGSAKVCPSSSGRKSLETGEQDSSRGGSEQSCTPLSSHPKPSCSIVSSSAKLQSPSFVLLFPLSDSETPPRRSQSRKRKFPEASFDSDETQSIIDPMFAPVESEHEDSIPPVQNTPPLDSEDRSRDNKEPRKGINYALSGDDEVCNDSDFESQSLLKTEYHHDNVLFTVIADSGPSIESVADNNSDPCSPAEPSPADTPLIKFDQSVSAQEQTADLHSNITIPENSPVRARLSFDFPQSGGATDKSSSVQEVLCGDLPIKVKGCKSQEIPPLMTNELKGSHVKCPHDHPLDLTAPGGCCMAHVEFCEPVGHVGVSDSGAALFWRRCNEVGCTEDIFTELTRQLTCLAERVQNRHATQQDYAVSLKILEASGKLPAIFRQVEQDLENQERELQRKREALRDVKAVLDENKLI
ncbi:uncharacterized protein phf11 isoform X2 [Ictalurus punctatus]|uniref:Uncharacterized protein phf11 isoform X2 n=1 Tax=Ictalurus punctatus TaxID=7998 RepID=A0A2D0R2E5_ICTPU|nr:uncharacterized protein phf11 isoform X2 [Ictalurus punctatus]